jgi:hypothetical protein
MKGFGEENRINPIQRGRENHPGTEIKKNPG